MVRLDRYHQKVSLFQRRQACVQHRAIYTCKVTACVSIKDLQNLNLHLHGHSQFSCGSVLIEDNALQYVSTISGSRLLGLYFFHPAVTQNRLARSFLRCFCIVGKLFITVRNLRGSIQATLAFEQNSVYAWIFRPQGLFEWVSDCQWARYISL